MKVEFFGEHNGTPVKKYTLEKDGMSVSVIDYGATVTSIVVPDAYGVKTDVLLGYDSLPEYENNAGYLGASIGRVANRVSNAAFSYNGKEYKLFNNDEGNSLHGGKEGFDKKVWNSYVDGDEVVMNYTSPDGEEGYFGELRVCVRFFIGNERDFHIVYNAVTDTESVVNLTNHAYFNLNGQGGGPIAKHQMKINSSCITAVNENLVPYGEFADVEGTPFDFRQPKIIGKDVNVENAQLEIAGGYDHNFVLDLKDGQIAAETIGDRSGIKMVTKTNQNGLQFYGGNFILPVAGKGGTRYDYREGFCLEAQGFPNSLNVEKFGQPILREGEVYENEIVYAFSDVSEDYFSNKE